MGEFFRGRRRKVGCVLLVLACGLMGLWLRSGRFVDLIVIPPVGGLRLTMLSKWEGLVPGLTFESPDIFTHPAAVSDPLGLWFTRPRHGERSEGPAIPHGIVVIPLTLLSARLLLWPRRMHAAAGQAR